MEGTWRGLAAWLAVTLTACALMVVVSGCGGDDESSATEPATVATDEPERTFAPLVELAAGEPWRPMSARWFIDHSLFGFAEDEGCPDRLIAVGRSMPELQNPVTDWIFPIGLGKGPHYYRNSYDAACELKSGTRFEANELTRPHDPGPRPPRLRQGEGYYLDLDDDARGGPAPGGEAPVYAERSDEGDSQVRLTYWLLFGMHGAPGAVDAREGDWERIDILLRDAGDGRYEPLAVQTMTADAAVVAQGSVAAAEQREDVVWADVRRLGGTHPVVTAERATHAMGAATVGDACRGCASVKGWQSLVDARDQLWYGFGGAWGEVGATAATTGPLGPHGRWPPPAAEG